MPKTTRTASRPKPAKKRKSALRKGRSRFSDFGFVGLLKPIKLQSKRSLAFAGTALAAGVVAVSVFAAAPPTGTATAACAKVIGPLKDKGTSVIQASGKPYIPYGVTVPGLAHADFQDYSADDASQITAAATGWCSNTVRLQVSQDTLVSSTGVVSAPFLAAIETEVTQAKSLGMVVVINDQTQDMGLEPGPTTRTVQFWKAISAVYGKDPQVVYDIFNEPYLSTGNTTSDWKIWENGGVYQKVTYLGMQQVADSIRSSGATNLLWIEGIDHAGTLALVPSYPVRADGPIMYSIHHPDGLHTAAVWNTDFGNLVTNDVAPVVVGEWTNYASATKSECWDDAPTAVPAFLLLASQEHRSQCMDTQRRCHGAIG
jgi:hypothetical protein